MTRHPRGMVDDAAIAGISLTNLMICIIRKSTN